VDDFAQAVAALQELTSQAESRSYLLTERYEEALNDLVRNPNRPGARDELIKVAVANARKKLARRAERAPLPATPTVEIVAETAIRYSTPPPESASPAPWVDRLRPRSRRLLGLTALGFPPRELALLENLTPQQTWVALSRARTEGRVCLLEAA
jgi:hypothetical protein